jgi:hypothetical protein
MKAMKTISALLLFLTMLSCAEDEPEFLVGDIIGRVGFYESNYFNWVDSAVSVKVTLVAEDGSTSEYTTSTDGRYFFKNMKAGNYGIFFDKPNVENVRFVDFTRDFRDPILHLGGGITIVNDNLLLESPSFVLEIVSFLWEDDLLTLVTSPSALEGDRFDFRIFFGSGNSVTDANASFDRDTRFDAQSVQYVSGSGGEKLVVFKLRVAEPEEFVVIYPYSIWSEQVLGDASNVFAIPK